jgi:hypothetical protein
VESIRPIVLWNRRIALFFGHDAGATETGASSLPLIETCKLNCVGPHAYFKEQPQHVVGKQSRQ